LARTGTLKKKVEPFPTVDSNPDAPAVHLNDPFGDRQPEAGAALGLGRRAVDLLELFEKLIWRSTCHPACRLQWATSAHYAVL